MSPFDGLTHRQHSLVFLALEHMRLIAWGGENPAPKEKAEYEELLAMLERARDI